MASVEIKSIDKARVKTATDVWAAELLQRRPDILEIVVFGSFEQDTYVPGSDLDVFLLLDRSDVPVRERIPDLLPGRFPVGLDVFPYTRKEVAELAPSPILDAVNRSRWRYKRPEAR